MSQAAGGSPARAEMADRVRAYPGTLTYIDLIARNKRASLWLIALMILLAIVVGAVLAAAFAVYGGSAPEHLAVSALLGAGAMFLFSILGTLWSWFGGAGAILAMSGAKEITHTQDPELFNVVDEMRLAAGLPMPRVYMIEDSAMNAFATGRDPAHAAVAITRGLRQRLTRDELQGVMAHEIAHIRHYDIRFAMLMATMVGLIVFAADASWRMLRYGGGGRRSKKEGGAAVVVVLVVALLLAILAPLIARMIQMAYSRQREYLADAGAVELSRNPQGLADALRKLADDTDPLVDVANRGTAHMFIVNPLRKMRESHQALNSVFSSHPPVKERIARLLALLR